MADTRIEKFVITAAFGEVRVARVRGEFVDGAFYFGIGDVGPENVFDTELAATEELLRRAKAILALLEG